MSRIQLRVIRSQESNHESIDLIIDDASTQQEERIFSIFKDELNSHKAYQPSEHSNLHINLLHDLKEDPREPEPEHYKTGVKTDPKTNEARYRCRYICTCGNKSNRYIPLGTTQVHCHECNELLDVSPSTPHTQDIQPDEKQNWFIAGLQKPLQNRSQHAYI